MGRVKSCLLASFRVSQFLFSLIALACGAYIVYKMYNLAQLAQVLEQAILGLQAGSYSKDEGKAIKVLVSSLVPVLQYLQSTPTRAIVLTAVSLVSVILIIYLFFARRSKNHPGADRQSIRVTLEILILLAWLGGTACAVLLALQYGTLALGGGVTIKLAMHVLRSVLQKKLQDIASQHTSFKNALDALDMVGDLVTIACLAIAGTVAASVCVNCSFISLIVACCSKSRKKETVYAEHGTPMSAAVPFNTTYEEKTPKTTYTERITRKPVNTRASSTSYITEANAPWQSSQDWQSPPSQRWQSPVQQSYHSPQSAQTWTSPESQTWEPNTSQRWHAPEQPMTPPVPYTAPTPYTGKPTPYMAFTSSQNEPYHYADNNQHYGRHVVGADQWGR